MAGRRCRIGPCLGVDCHRRGSLLRLRHDLVMLGRSEAVLPLPETLAPRLKAPIARVAEAAAEYLRNASAALVSREACPPIDSFESAFDSYSGEVAAIRREGGTRGLSNEEVSALCARLFARANASKFWRSRSLHRGFCPRRYGLSLRMPARSKRKARSRPAGTRRLLLAIMAILLRAQGLPWRAKNRAEEGPSARGRNRWLREFSVAALREQRPRAVLVGWDTLDAPTYRHQAFAAYQSGRRFDDALIEQLDFCCRGFVSGVRIRECEGGGIRGR